MIASGAGGSGRWNGTSGGGAAEDDITCRIGGAAGWLEPGGDAVLAAAAAAMAATATSANGWLGRGARALAGVRR
jgi:hypothetical protein